MLPNRRSCEVRLNSRPLQTVEPRLTYSAAGSKTGIKGWRGGFAKVSSLLGKLPRLNLVRPLPKQNWQPPSFSLRCVRTLTDVFASPAVSSFGSNFQTRSRRFRRFRFCLSLSPGQSLLYQSGMGVVTICHRIFLWDRIFSRRGRPCAFESDSGYFTLVIWFHSVTACEAIVDLAP